MQGRKKILKIVLSGIGICFRNVVILNYRNYVCLNINNRAFHNDHYSVIDLKINFTFSIRSFRFPPHLQI